MAELTPFQPVGPFFHLWLGSEPRGFARLIADGTQGERIGIAGALLDGAAAPVRDGLIEIWQADAAGRYPHSGDPGSAAADPAFGGYGRTATDPDGRFRFETIKPGAVAGPEGRRQAPHLLVRVYAPGILTPYWTRMYFAHEESNSADMVLQLVPESRRTTLLARRTGAGEYTFDIVLQGEHETVFFEVGG